ncbi:MAG: hypothetical protein A2600_02630 [Candidatus Lambdaproteobacteria bacterium RIFOXYD1_FULL_56_27]|uniref:Prenylated flavin chaperone LpdD-like domain-containing protein n=1 Tax=Candidatus Lambdaproteobacteria bacterium RIFOXYD2_FULL_56_26 TaxID=1817773 RepID=A0A1F6H2R3_9PROT|nr:MAG: hypothetical protein A2426_02985 [Candidatus Lambdaproteobacteria bacterium RIFOXYC1_FULL_56_13]OGH04673.1 MAG: hypothetical protein A2557_06695 [Candidatus Lambdaproteobacteria bacterium RIFOXYD2_FULL_56_26]OGH09137.1 MAG: hypothetical protein A2600_02630 [Candidatus Lambdaproteobacteria bacterium RIFOXYD1_FULL_56_27]
MPWQVDLQVYQWGRDFVAFLGGGERHLGAVAFAGTALVQPPHKEGPIAQELALELRSFLPGNVAVLAGIHYEGLEKSQISEVLAQARALVAQFRSGFLPQKTGSPV